MQISVKFSCFRTIF